MLSCGYCHLVEVTHAVQKRTAIVVGVARQPVVVVLRAEVRVVISLLGLLVACLTLVFSILLSVWRPSTACNAHKLVSVLLIREIAASSRIAHILFPANRRRHLLIALLRAIISLLVRNFLGYLLRVLVLPVCTSCEQRLSRWWRHTHREVGGRFILFLTTEHVECLVLSLHELGLFANDLCGCDWFLLMVIDYHLVLSFHGEYVVKALVAGDGGELVHRVDEGMAGLVVRVQEAVVVLVKGWSTEASAILGDHKVVL